MSTIRLRRASSTASARATRFAFWFAVGCCAAVVGVVLPFAGGSPSSMPSGPPDFVQAAPIPAGEPCAGAEDVSLGVLQARAKGVVVRLPDQKVAGAAISGAGFCAADDTQPVVIVGGNIWVFYESGYPESERDAWLARLAKEYGGTVTSFNGASAYVHASDDKAVRSQVILSVPATQQIIRIQAPYGVAIEALESVARAFNTGAAQVS